MAVVEIRKPFEVFNDTDGKPLDSGYVYIGVSGSEPKSAPKAVFWDSGLTIPAVQPLRTQNGFIVNNGTPAAFYTDGAYSLKVVDYSGVTIALRLVNSDGALALGTMASQNEGTGGGDFRDNADNDARFLLRSEYSPSSAGGSGQFKIINGDFAIVQRGVGIGASGNLGSFSADRWRMWGAITNPAQWEILANTGAVGPFNPIQVLRLSTASQVSATEYTRATQFIEDARTYQGQTVTIFGWARRSVSGNIAISAVQNFGTGGSPSASVTINATAASTCAIGTGFTAFRAVLVIPTTVGKTFGSDGNSNLAINIWTSAGANFSAESNSLGLQNAIVDLYGIHDRPGDQPIDVINFYQPPDPQPEFSRCQRYYQKYNGVGACGRVSDNVIGNPNRGRLQFQTRMRAVPTASFTYDTGTGAGWAISTDGVTQNVSHSAQAAVTTAEFAAEL